LKMGAQQGKERGSHSSGGGGGHGGTVSCIGVSSSSSPVASGSPHCISVGSSGGALSAGSTLRGSRMKSHQSAGHGSSGISIGSSGSSGLSSHRGGSNTSHKDNRCNPTVGLNIFTEHNGEYAFMYVCACVYICTSATRSKQMH